MPQTRRRGKPIRRTHHSLVGCADMDGESGFAVIPTILVKKITQRTRDHTLAAGDRTQALACVLLNLDTVVHVVNTQDLLLTLVATELVVFTHDQRLHGLGRTDL